MTFNNKYMKQTKKINLKLKFFDEMHVSYTSELEEDNVDSFISLLEGFDVLTSLIIDKTAFTNLFEKLKQGCIIMDPKHLNCSIEQL